MTEYHKIQSLFKRDMGAPRRPLIPGEWTTPEFAYLAENHWVFTEKVDGTNIRVIREPTSTWCGGRTHKAQIPVPLKTRLDELFQPLDEQLREMFPEGGVVFYGEGYGPGINKGGKYRDTVDFVLFDIRIGQWWLRRDAVEDIAAKLGLDTVPVVGEGTLLDAVYIVQNGLQSHWGDFEAEGIVARPQVELHTRSGERIIAKVKGRDFPKE